MQTRIQSWISIKSFLIRQSYHEDFQIDKNEIAHPSTYGFRKSVGELKGQDADWRSDLRDGSSIHVLEYPNRYTYHRDKVNPDRDAWGHLVHDAPHWLFIGAILIVVIVGGAAYAATRGKKSGET